MVSGDYIRLAEERLRLDMGGHYSSLVKTNIYSLETDFQGLEHAKQVKLKHFAASLACKRLPGLVCFIVVVS